MRISKLIFFAWACFFYLGPTAPAAIPTKVAEIHTIPESTTPRIADGLNFRPLAEKAKVRQCFNRCGWNRVRSTRFENNQSGEKLFKKARLLIAADSSEGKEANDAGKTTENRSTPKTEKGTHKEKPSSKDNTDPLTTFEPTEKVKADQAVDFPYDI